MMELASHSMDAAVAFTTLLDAALKGTFILLVAAFAIFLLRKSSAANKHLIWFLGVVSLLILPSLSIMLPAWRILPQWTDNGRQAASKPVIQNALPQPALIAGSRPSADGDAARVEAVSHIPGTPLPSPIFAGPEAERREVAVVPALAVVDTIGSHWTSARIIQIWLAGVVIALCPALLGMMSLWRLERSSREITDSAWVVLLDDLARAIGVTRRVRMLQSDRRSMPMTWGLRGSRLLVPKEADGWPDDRRRVVLLHELAHIKRRDTLTNLVTQLTCALYWFHPLAWFAARRMVSERERACDDLVLATGVKQSAYAEHLLQVVSGLESRLFATYNAIAMARSSKLHGRLLAIMKPNGNRKAVTRRALLISITLCAVGLLPVAVLQSRSGEVKSTDDATQATAPPAVVFRARVSECARALAQLQMKEASLAVTHSETHPEFVATKAQVKRMEIELARLERDETLRRFEEFSRVLGREHPDAEKARSQFIRAQERLATAEQESSSINTQPEGATRAAVERLSKATIRAAKPVDPIAACRAYLYQVSDPTIKGSYRSVAGETERIAFDFSDVLDGVPEWDDLQTERGLAWRASSGDLQDHEVVAQLSRRLDAVVGPSREAGRSALADLCSMESALLAANPGTFPGDLEGAKRPAELYRWRAHANYRPERSALEVMRDLAVYASGDGDLNEFDVRLILFAAYYSWRNAIEGETAYARRIRTYLRTVLMRADAEATSRAMQFLEDTCMRGTDADSESPGLYLMHALTCLDPVPDVTNKAEMWVTSNSENYAHRIERIKPQLELLGRLLGTTHLP